ncbi:MAG TPA: efflux RND transporter permease subunit, partial [Actinopolymorphaceae bacterium]
MATDSASRIRPRRGRRRVTWLLLGLLVVAWLALGAFAGPYTGMLTDVSENDNSSFLPESAESTAVSELQQRFVEEESLPAVVIAERSSGIRPSDRAFLADRAADLRRLDGVAGEGSPPIPSRDGKAIQLIVPISGDAEVSDAVEAVRAELADPPEGLTVLVTGPAGQIADLGEAFGGIDGLLLLVAGGVVAVILVVVYRSPVLPFLVLLSAVLALGTASLLVYLLADSDVITLNGQSQGILFILVFGAATDYALLLVARLREELRETDDRFEAMWRAWRSTIEPIAASAATVVVGVLCLLVSDLRSNQGLGPVAATGIVCSFLASVTFLPAVLALCGRAAFWPFRPTLGSPHPEASGIWGRVARALDRRPRAIWLTTTAVLLVAAAFLPQLKAGGTPQSDIFLTAVDSVEGQKVLARHFPAGSGSPTVVIARA